MVVNDNGIKALTTATKPNLIVVFSILDWKEQCWECNLAPEIFREDLIILFTCNMKNTNIAFGKKPTCENIPLIAVVSEGTPALEKRNNLNSLQDLKIIPVIYFEGC